MKEEWPKPNPRNVNENDFGEYELCNILVGKLKLYNFTKLSTIKYNLA